MQQETTEALNEQEKIVSYDRNKIEHMNSTNSLLIVKVKILEELIRVLKS